MSQSHELVSPFLEARQLSVVLGGRQVIEIPSFSVYPNEVLAIMGPNGAGKTTLLLSLALLLKPAAGNILYRGKPVKYESDKLRLRRRFAVLFQEPLLLSGSTWDNVTLGLRMRGVKKEEIKARANKWLERFGVAQLAKRQASTLSGGEAKRVSLARAFVLQPEVLFLDEPFTSLDSPTRRGLLEDFESVVRETKITTVMVTHDLNEALLLADRQAVLINGNIRQIGTPAEVFSYPADEDVASFVEAGNILHGVVSSQTSGLALVDVGEQQLEAVSELTVGTKVIMVLHHDDIILSLPSPQNMRSSARNQIAGKVVKVVPIGSQMRVTVDCGITLVALITRRSWEELGLRVGLAVIASFKASSIHMTPRR